MHIFTHFVLWGAEWLQKYLKRFDIKVGNYNYLKKVAEEIFDKKFKMEDRFKQKFRFFHFLAGVDYENGILRVEFSSMLMEYLLQIRDKYLKYDIKNIMSLNSKYSIRLYKILKDNLEKNLRYGSKAELKISLDELREIFEIPKSYQYSSGIKKRILEKTKAELKEHTDILFDYEEIKTGRKVTAIKFLICFNPSELEDNYNKKNEKYFKSRAMFVKLLRNNYAGNKKMFGYKTLDKRNFWIGIDNKGLMYATLGNELRNFNSSESADIYDTWYKIAKNSELYQDLILNGICLKEVYEENKELYLEFMQELFLLKEQGII